MSSLLKTLDRFFFQYEAAFAVGFFRVAFGLTLFMNALARALHSDFYFTPLGGVPWEGATEVLPEFVRPAFEMYPKTIAGIYGVQAVLLGSLLLIVFGVFGRIGSRVLAAAALCCQLALIQRNYSIVYGADIVSGFWLFALVFMNTGVSRRQDVEWSKILTSVGIRLVQLQLCLIYGYTGFEKLKGTEWWDQTAVWNVLGNDQLMMMDLSALRSVPLLIAIVTWGTILFEIYMPALVWHKPLKKWVLLSGVGLHSGIAAIMGLIFFSCTMMSSYFLFLDDDELKNLPLVGRLSSLFARLPLRLPRFAN